MKKLLSGILIYTEYFLNSVGALSRKRFYTGKKKYSELIEEKEKNISFARTLFLCVLFVAILWILIIGV